jgi:hypothetical protein
MAIFKIIHTKIKTGISAYFDIEMIEGDINIGDIIVTFDTHHPTKWEIKDIKQNNKLITIEMETGHFGLCWEDQYADTILNVDKNNKRYLECLAKK